MLDSYVHSCADVVTPPDADFLRDWVYDNPVLADRRELLTRWLTDPTPREDIAASMGIPLGRLLRSFNETAPLADPVRFRYRGVPFSVVAMAGTCDDVQGDRFPRFGRPVTLRCYLDDETLLPQGMFEAADWNFMDAGRPGFLGYAYGVHHDSALYLAGVQSDLAVRYTYLFQGRGGETEVRIGDEVEVRGPDDRYRDHVPVLRRTFQRYWIQIMFGAVLAWARREPGLRELGLLRFDLEPEESANGHVVRRVYRDLPERLGSPTRCVRVEGRCHRYAMCPLPGVADYLGARWQPVDAG
ncbi:hypothetical protein SAMN05421805_10361 [Saccharopolyspora antimicrobica]|uniref:Uncharacterized protein n=1 Tax=Saccharopolyspora antimicrobica TaxID=455193 RepID=A0A1I4WUF2_9PSEU|nr:hypothetical protein [Saccharopolyspora antimicrobica]RKT82965.1 hypothetical protein ATL45_1229 [Saccharopolyspora antimicrobica]SFN16982.1 hypothetical protein SAMN05421805_10361 [Saccharopolyspora antimicrobica]